MRTEIISYEEDSFIFFPSISFGSHFVSRSVPLSIACESPLLVFFVSFGVNRAKWVISTARSLFNEPRLNPNGDSSSRVLVLLLSSSSPSQTVYSIVRTMDVHHEGNLARLQNEIVSSIFASVFFH